MPELPEVETVRRSLERRLEGIQIVGVELYLPRLVKWPEPDIFIRRLENRRIVAVRRTGKYLRFVLDNATELVIHLKMTGQLFYDERGAGEKIAYRRAAFRLRGGAVLWFGDARTLGALYAVTPEEMGRLPGMMAMGPEPLSDAFTPAYWQKLLRTHRGKIKSLLLNQRYIGGLGNIYADEALFLAKIHPERPAFSLTIREAERLFTAVNDVIRAGIADGGTTVRNYLDGEGRAGSHQEKLQVYQRTGESCPRCGTAIERIVVGGRGSHFCPRCQKKVSRRWETRGKKRGI